MTPAAQPQRALTSPEADVLGTHLGEESEVQEALLALLERQETCLTRNDLLALSACLAEASPVLNRLEDLTRRRARLLANFARSLGLPPETARFSELVALGRPQDRARLEPLLARLKDVLRRIDRQNLRNRMLVRTGLDVNQALVRALFGGSETTRTYDRAAQSQEAAPTRPYLSREL